MGYYMRGDYYRGDYYRGDPFLGALVGGVVGKAAARAGSWIARRAVGARGAAAAVARDAAPAVVGGAVATALNSRVPSLGPIPSVGPSGASMPFFGPKKYRRINPLNPKALKRALRRAEGFEKFAKRTVNAMYKVIDGRRVKTFKRTRKS